MINCIICGREMEYDEGEFDGADYTCYECIEEKIIDAKKEIKKECYECGSHDTEKLKKEIRCNKCWSYFGRK